MQLAANPPFSLFPGEVVSADAQRWQRALTFSLALHALLLGAVLQRQLMPDEAVAPPPLTVFLPRPVAAVAPAPVSDEEPLPRHPVAESREASPREVMRAPADSTFAVPMTPPSADIAPPPVPANPVAALPASPMVQAPPAPPRAPASPDQAALAGYNRALAAAVDRHKHYPRIALMRQWQGTVILQLNIGADGRLQDYRLARSSGYDALDQQALEMLRAAMPLPTIPAQLAGMDLAVDIPVVFRMTD